MIAQYSGREHPYKIYVYNFIGEVCYMLRLKPKDKEPVITSTIVAVFHITYHTKRK